MEKDHINFIVEQLRKSERLKEINIEKIIKVAEENKSNSRYDMDIFSNFMKKLEKIANLINRKDSLNSEELSELNLLEIELETLFKEAKI